MARSLRVFIANLLLAMAWSLRWGCARCANRLVRAARRIAPEAARYLILRGKAPDRKE